MTIPDFAVSSQEAGFDEFLKVFNEYFKLSCRGEFLFYGASDGQPQRDDIRWTNKFILPHAAIALLTGKQLTEGEQLTDKSKHKLLYSNLTKDFTWCGVCNEHFHNSEGYHDVKLLPTQESVKGEVRMNKESRKKIESLILDYAKESIGYRSCIEGVCAIYNSETAHLQQQLKEAKELLNNTDDLLTRLEDYTHGKDGESITELRASINKFLTRNK